MILDCDQLLQEHIEVALATNALLPQLQQVCEQTVKRLQQGGKVLFAGNGGSAADAQHMAAELIGRFYLERAAIPAIAVTTDSSILTCLSNDYHYDIVFSRQFEALCNAQDVAVLMSTSGGSNNLVKAAEVAKSKGAYTIAFLGKDGGQLKNVVDAALVVPSHNTPRIQEMHLFLGHTFCEWIEKALA
jgi:D-sedoheptulose 7-phosphate isomerase